MDAYRRDDIHDEAPQPIEILSVIEISKIRLNPRQPRRSFDEAGLDELADSIRAHGVIEPVIVRPTDDEEFELVAGERRFRASMIAGLHGIPAVVRVLNDRQTLEVALIENLQREDIKPLECAEAYRRLVDEFGLTYEQIARQVGKNRSTIANTLRLLNLPPRILESLDKGEITEGHARAILSFADPDEQIRAWEKVVAKELSVRETERLSQMRKFTKTSKTRGVSRESGRHGHGDPILADVEDKLKRFLGTKVSIKSQADGQGSIEIEFYDAEDLMRIIELMSQI